MPRRGLSAPQQWVIDKLTNNPRFIHPTGFTNHMAGDAICCNWNVRQSLLRQGLIFQRLDGKFQLAERSE